MQTNLQIVVVVAALLVASAVAGAAPPLPTIYYTVNPSSNMTRDAPIPTCPPLVEGVDGAFICYVERDGIGRVQFVTPSAPTTTNPVASVSFDTPGYIFLQTPIWIGFHSAIVASNFVDQSFWTIASISGVLPKMPRYGSNARVSFDPFSRQAFVPQGPQASTGYKKDTLQAFTIQPGLQTPGLAWSQSFNIPFGFTGDTLMQEPVVYRDLVYLMQGNKLTVMNVTASPGSQVVATVVSPCNLKPASGYYLHLKVVNFGEDDNGSLDAFIIYGNTTTVENGTEFSFCRISHHSYRSAWPHNYTSLPYDFQVHSIHASKDTLFLSGRDTGINYDTSFELHAYDIKSGHRKWIVQRSSADKNADALAIPSDPFPPSVINNCSEGIVLFQVNGQLTCRCLDDVYQVLWTSLLPCSYAPLLLSLDDFHVGCVHETQTAHVVRVYDGTPRWVAPIRAKFGMQYAGGLVWVIDVTSTLYGIGIDLPSPPPPPPSTPTPEPEGPSGGVSGGAVAGIVIGIFGGFGAIGGGLFWYSKRRVRRTGYEMPVDDNQGYGSVH